MAARSWLWLGGAAVAAAAVGAAAMMVVEHLKRRGEEQRLDRFYDRVVVKLAPSSSSSSSSNSAHSATELSSPSQAMRMKLGGTDTKTLDAELAANARRCSMVGFHAADERWRAEMLYQQLSEALRQELTADETYAVYLYSTDLFYHHLNAAWQSQEQDRVNGWCVLSRLLMEALYKLEKFGGDLSRVVLTRYTMLSDADKRVYQQALTEQRDLVLCNFVSLSLREDLQQAPRHRGGENCVNAKLVFRSSSSILPASARISKLSCVLAEQEHVMPPLTKLTVEAITEDASEAVTVVSMRVQSLFFLLELQAALQD